MHMSKGPLLITNQIHDCVVSLVAENLGLIYTHVLSLLSLQLLLKYNCKKKTFQLRSSIIS